MFRLKSRVCMFFRLFLCSSEIGKVVLLVVLVNWWFMMFCVLSWVSGVVGGIM